MRSDISPISRVMRRVDLAADGESATDTLATGFPSIDRWLGGGIRRGDLVVLAGDVGSGKSALALAMAMRMAQGGHKVAFLTAEMGPERVMERAVALDGRVRVDDLRRGNLDDVARASVGGAAVRIRDAMPLIAAAPLGMDDAMRVIAEAQASETAVIFLDSLQGLPNPTPLGVEEGEAEWVRRLKREAVDRNVALVLICQLRREAGHPPEERPTLADLGAKDAVRQHADVVTALYREEMYRPGGGAEGGTEFLVLKNRNGATGYVDLYFYQQWLRFEDMLDPDR